MFTFTALVDLYHTIVNFLVKIGLIKDPNKGE